MLSEDKFTEVHFSSVGPAVGKLINIVEVFKILHANLHQVNRIGSVTFDCLDNDSKMNSLSLLPKLEVVLSKDKPDTLDEGYQEPISEELREQLKELLENASKLGTAYLIAMTETDDIAETDDMTIASKVTPGSNRRYDGNGR